VEAARRATDHLGFRNAQFDVASADRLPFPVDTLDSDSIECGALRLA
jgi:hypothetical protein